MTQFLRLLCITTAKVLLTAPKSCSRHSGNHRTIPWLDNAQLLPGICHDEHSSADDNYFIVLGGELKGRAYLLGNRHDVSPVEVDIVLPRSTIVTIHEFGICLQNRRYGCRAGMRGLYQVYLFGMVPDVIQLLDISPI